MTRSPATRRSPLNEARARREYTSAPPQSQHRKETLLGAGRDQIAPDHPRENTTLDQPDTKIAKTIKGGIDNGSDTRLRRQLTLLSGLNLDVAALQECKHWADDNSALLHMAEEQLGMTGFLAKSPTTGATWPCSSENQPGFR